MLVLTTLINGCRETQELTDGTWFIGRGGMCRVRLDFPDVSERHAILTVRGGEETPYSLGELWAGRQRRGQRDPLRLGYLQALLRRINTVLLRGGTTPDARFQCGAAAPPRPEMGTTAAILLLLDDVYIAVHIGDSRIYAFSEREPLITCDHSWVMEEVKAGRLRKEEMKNDPRRNILMRCLGITQDAEADVTFGRRKENAVYLVCSDGFWRENETDEFEILLAGRSPENRRSAQAALARILDRNMSRGEDDNMSAVWIREERLKGKRSKQDGIKQRF